MARYRCRTCLAVAEIDLEKRTMILEPRAPNVPMPQAGRVTQVAYSFPSHADCEFNRPLDKIRLDRLERVDTHASAYEKGVPR